MKESPQHGMTGDSSLIGVDVAKRVDRKCKRMRWCAIWRGHSGCTTTKTECLVQLLSISYPPTSFCVASLPKGVGHGPSMSIVLTCWAMFIAFKRMLINRKVGSIWQWLIWEGQTWPSFLKNPTESRFLNLPISCNTPVRSFSCIVWIRASKNSGYGLGWSGFAICSFFLGVYIHPKKAQNDGLFNFFCDSSLPPVLLPPPGSSIVGYVEATEVEQACDPTSPQTVMQRLNAYGIGREAELRMKGGRCCFWWGGWCRGEIHLIKSMLPRYRWRPSWVRLKVRRFGRGPGVQGWWEVRTVTKDRCHGVPWPFTIDRQY